MKPNSILALGAVVLVVATGCSTFQPETLVLDNVGPDPSAAADLTATNGTLEVYSAYRAGADFNIRDDYRHEFSSYQILTANGKRLQMVINDSGTILQRPATVPLAPGQYRVVARANSYGEVTVPVTIATGQNTVVHLEGGVRWPGSLGLNETNSVRLPDGEIVGWRGQSAKQ